MNAAVRTRGDATREALIRAGLEIFGRDGFHAAGTRAIARAAGVNQALIGFHFGGKKGLYMATFEYVVGQVMQRMGPAAQTIKARLEKPPPQAGRSAAARARTYLPLVFLMTDAMVEMFTSEEAKTWARLVLREQQDPSEAFERHFPSSMGSLMALFSELVARIRNRSSAEREIRLIAVTIVGQALVFRAASAAVLRHLGSRKISSEDVAGIQKLIRRNVAAVLRAGANP